jgi:hypothetical protein
MPYADAKYPAKTVRSAARTFDLHGERTTKVVLANGQPLLVIESCQSVAIALGDMRVDEVDKFVCRIQPHGVTVCNHSDYACACLSLGGPD